MNGLIRLLILGAMIANLTSCVSRSSEDDLSLDIEDGTELTYEGTPEDDEFADTDVAAEKEAPQEEFSDEFSDGATQSQVADAGAGADEFDDSFAEPSGDASSDFADDDVLDAPPQVADNGSAGESLDDEFADFEESPTNTAQAPAATAPQDDLAFDDSQDLAMEEAPAPIPDIVVEEEPQDLAAQSDVPADEFDTAGNAQFEDSEIDTLAQSSPAGGSSKITDLKFQANDTGGTVIVQGDSPLVYKTRVNTENNQFIVEVENTSLPERLKRPLNTKDIQGSIGAVDAYQNPGSNVARFVVQMRDGAGIPVVQQEGNSLLIVANGQGVATADSSGNGSSGSSSVDGMSTSGEEAVASVDGESFHVSGRILPSQSLDEFLSGNTKFYGKKISVETNNMDIRDALNLITEESGVNMIVSDDIKGMVNLKLRQVPWDQALVVLMRAKRLGYTRQGNVLRIAPLSELKTEEEDATKMAMAKKSMEPLVVRMFPVSYAKVEDLDKKIKDFLGEKGKVVGDPRTNSIVVTDTQENVDRVAKLILSLDTQPPQVSIEGKIVEASESFTRNIGVSWGASGAPIQLSSSVRGPVNMTPSLSVNSAARTVGALNLNLSVGTLDIFGTLNAMLQLNEVSDQVKVISAPRITTLSNEAAAITQVTEVPVKQVTQNGTATVTTYTFKPLTLKLDVTPQVTADGSVIMKVLVNRQIAGADVSADGSGQFSVNSREATTRVLVKNGQTAVIGGIYQSDATEGRSGVPWLMNVPLLKYLFTSDNTKKAKSELMIFLTPRIQGDVFGQNSSSETRL